MDAIDAISQWLDRPVYGEGVLLYERYIAGTSAGSGFVLTMLKAGDDDYNRDKLTATLEAKRDALLAERQAMQRSYPEPLRDQLDRGKNLQDERTVLKERMRLRYNGGVDQGEEHKADAFQILAIRDDLGHIYGRKNFFEQNGYLPEMATIDAEESPADLLKRRNTLRTYVTRYTKLLRGMIGEEQMQTYTEKLHAYQAELHQVEQQLNALTETPNVPLHD